MFLQKPDDACFKSTLIADLYITSTTIEGKLQYKIKKQKFKMNMSNKLKTLRQNQSLTSKPNSPPSQ